MCVVPAQPALLRICDSARTLSHVTSYTKSLSFFLDFNDIESSLLPSSHANLLVSSWVGMPAITEP